MKIVLDAYSNDEFLNKQYSQLDCTVTFELGSHDTVFIGVSGKPDEEKVVIPIQSLRIMLDAMETGLNWYRNNYVDP